MGLVTLVLTAGLGRLLVRDGQLGRGKRGEHHHEVDVRLGGAAEDSTCGSTELSLCMAVGCGPRTFLQ